jgi:tight adherence protein B
MHPPIADEFQRVLQEVQVGISVSDALEGLLARSDSYDLELVVAAMQTQLTMGGNLSEVLDNIAGMIRERVRLQGEIDAATSEGRMSAGILVAMPIVMALIISAVSPGYLNPLFEQRLGLMLLMIAGGLMLAGVLIIRKMLDIDI